jgi:hypothetical protein
MTRRRTVNIIKIGGSTGRGVAGLLGAVLLIVGISAVLPMAAADAAGAATPVGVPAIAPATPGGIPAVSTPAAPVAPSASCPAQDECSTEFQGDAASVKTTNGVTWMLSVSGSSNQVTVELARKASASPLAFEIHGWTFPVTSGGLTFSAGTGVGTIDPGTQTSPIATVNVTFHSTASKVVAGACTSGTETKYTGTLTGSVKLVTGITGGGTVSSSSFSAASSKPAVIVDSDCVAPNTCLAASKAFDDDPSPLANPNLLASGGTGTFAGTAGDQVTLADDTTLAKPAGADRIDESLVQAAPSTWTASTKTLVVTTESSGLVTGSVTISGGKKSSSSIPCTKAGKSVKNVITFYSGATWTSPAGQALTAHNELGPSLVMPLTNTKADTFLTSTSA